MGQNRERVPGSHAYADGIVQDAFAPFLSAKSVQANGQTGQRARPGGEESGSETDQGLEQTWRRLRGEMHVYTGQIALAASVLVYATACVSAAPKKVSSASCSIGAECTLTGTLTILRGMPASVGVIETQTGCVPLALAPEVYAQHEQWDDKPVEVSGPSFAQSDLENLVSYEVKDRKVATGGCNSSPFVIYVTEIKRR